MKETLSKEIPLVDAHVHLDLFPDEAKILSEAETHRIHLIAVTNAPSVFFHTRDVAKTNANVHAAVGLHPELVASHEREMESIESHLATTQFVGEVGLDYSTSDQELRKRQRHVFSSILNKCDAHGGKVISVHSRRATKDVVAAIGSNYRGSVILHWFSGTPKELEEAIRIGCRFSINPAMTLSLAGQRLIKMMPRNRILTETDGPFVQIQNCPASPINVQDSLAGIAAAWETDINTVARQVWSNFCDLPFANVR